MPVVTPPVSTPARRRTPTQVRSRERVEKILDAASQIVVAGGVEALTTRSIAEAAEIPVASLYQYFADRDEILLALVERDTAEMDEHVYVQRIREHIESGRRSNVRGTPGLVLNGMIQDASPGLRGLVAATEKILHGR